MRALRFLLSGCLIGYSGCSDGATAQVDEVDGAPADTGSEVSAEAATDSIAVSETGDATPTSDVGADTAKPSDASKPCTEPGAKVSEGHCYFPTSPAAWSDTKKTCEKAGAHLVTVTGELEHLFVSTFGGITDRWLGLERAVGDPVLKESYKWITGEPSTLDKWSLTEPNASGTCGEMTPSGLWADAECTKLFPGLCERD